MLFTFPRNFTFEDLLEGAKLFHFKVDVRGPWPTVISLENPQLAMSIRCPEDIIMFIDLLTPNRLK